MRPRRPRLFASIALTLLTAPLLTGCRLDAVVQIDLDRDGAGTLHVDIMVDRALLTRAAASGVDPLAELAGRVRPLPGWQVRVAPSGEGGRAVGLSARFDDAEGFNALMERFARTLAAPELAPLEALRLERQGDRVRLTGAAGLRPGAAVSDLGMSPDEATARLAESVHYQVTLTVPGEVADTNADLVQDGGLIWAVPAGQRVQLFAETVLPGSVVTPLLAGGALAGLLAAWWLRRRGELARRPAPHQAG